MKRNKNAKSEAGESTVAPTEPRLVLKRRPVASLSEKQLSDAAGGHPHTCHATCPPTCCGDTCQATCRTCYDTCANDTCLNSCDEYECPVP